MIAEVGYGQASFARIAERAGLSSTRLISYHFAGKDDLITAVAEDVVASIGDYVARRLRAERAPSGSCVPTSRAWWSTRWTTARG